MSFIKRIINVIQIVYLYSFLFTAIIYFIVLKTHADFILKRKLSYLNYFAVKILVIFNSLQSCFVNCVINQVIFNLIKVFRLITSMSVDLQCTATRVEDYFHQDIALCWQQNGWVSLLSSNVILKFKFVKLDSRGFMIL